jgi:hypothetical protein
MPTTLNILRAQSLAELARCMIRNSTFNQITAYKEHPARVAIVRELIRRGVAPKPVAPRRVADLARTDTVLPLIIEALERAPASVFMVEAEHYSCPGRIVPAHPTRDSAIEKAVEIANLILKDARAKKPATGKDYAARIEALSEHKVGNGLSPCYVDISEHTVVKE